MTPHSRMEYRSKHLLLRGTGSPRFWQASLTPTSSADWGKDTFTISGMDDEFSEKNGFQGCQPDLAELGRFSVEFEGVRAALRVSFRAIATLCKSDVRVELRTRARTLGTSSAREGRAGSGTTFALSDQLAGTCRVKAAEGFVGRNDSTLT